MYYKADHKYISILLSKVPEQKLQCAGILLSNGPQQQRQFECLKVKKQPLKCVSTLLLNFIQGAPKRKCNV